MATQRIQLKRAESLTKQLQDEREKTTQRPRQALEQTEMVKPTVKMDGITLTGSKRRRALIIHPVFSIYGGGEYVCLNVVAALYRAGYEVTLVSSDYNDERSMQAFRVERVNFDVKRLPRFTRLVPRASALQKAFYLRREVAKLVDFARDYDIIVHTQTASFLGSYGKPTFNVFYDPSDIDRRGSRWREPYYRFLRIFLNGGPIVRDVINIPLSQNLEDYLERAGYRHTSYVYPPCDMSFAPREKKRQIIQVTRTVPGKRLALFLEVARRLPNYHFLMVGYLSTTEAKVHGQFARDLIEKRPGNVEYIEERIRDCPQRLEESMVYLQTSIEPGINISASQGVGAGCIPVTPWIGGGSEIVKTLKVGYSYRSVEEAAESVKECIENPRWSPEELSRKAQIFNAENFQSKIASLIEMNSR